MPNVKKDTFQGYSVDSKLNTLFDYQIETHGLLVKQVTACEDRFSKVENGQRKWKIASGTMAAGSGFLGGALVMLSKLAFWK